MVELALASGRRQEVRCRNLGQFGLVAMTANGTEKERPARPVRSVLRALAIVDALAAHPRGATPKALSGELGLHLSTTYHLLNTLVASGHVARSAESRLFQLGPRIPFLQHRFRQGLASGAAIMPFLSALHQATGDTVHIGRLLGDDTAVVAALAGGRPDATPAGYVGYAMPAHASAMGQVLLAWSHPEQIASYLTRADFSARPPLKTVTPALIRERLETIRKNGYALDPGGHTPPLVGCVAAPVCLADGKAELAMAVIVPIARYELEQTRLVKLVVSAARAASEFAASERAGEGYPPDPQFAILNAVDWVGTKIDAPKSAGRTRRRQTDDLAEQ